MMKFFSDFNMQDAIALLVLIIPILFVASCNFRGTGNMFAPGERGADNYDMPALQVVDYVNLERYTGTWYEIARYPHKFQEGCAQSQATYSLVDGKLAVLNECYEKSQPGKIRSAKGKAWVVDSKTNAKLKVSFFWPFSGDYWIIDLGENYEFAVVGHPKRKYLWILSRTRELSEKTYQKILSRLKNQGYDTSRLVKHIDIRSKI